jgi:6-phosphogluconate dehydrogenase
MPAQFGMIGLGTMGRNLVLNMADKDIIVCGYDKDPAQGQRLKEESGGKNVTVAGSMEDLVNSLEFPRRIMMLVPAGRIVDLVIDELSPFLKPGDILIDGGNSHFTDTNLRIEKLKTAGIHFTGMGVSGGEAGARTGPSMMPGGSPESYTELKPILEKIAAQTADGPCVSFIGNGSAGHYTKMVHNGIEYAMMQLISEVYEILKRIGKLDNTEIADIFREWDKTELQSFLVEITAIVLSKQDEVSGKSLVDIILDKAKQKGTGMWTSQSAMDLNVPLSIIDTAVSMRYLSAMKEQRIKAHSIYHPAIEEYTISKTELIKSCKHALLFGFVLSYGQGLDLLNKASEFYKYEINIASVTRIWKGGCIIRSAMLNDLKTAYEAEPGLENIMLSKQFSGKLSSWRADIIKLTALGMNSKIPMAALSASLQYFDAYCSDELPANLIQAQRDYFCAHTYERRDQAGIFHTNWEDKT